MTMAVSNGQGSAPAVKDTPSVQQINGFAKQVIENGDQQWPRALENLTINIGKAGLDTDPDLAQAVGVVREAAKSLAAAGRTIQAVMTKHVSLAQKVSETKNHGSKMKAYENQ